MTECPMPGTGGHHTRSFDEGGKCQWCGAIAIEKPPPKESTKVITQKTTVTGPARCPSCKHVMPQLYDGECALCRITSLKHEHDTRMNLANETIEGQKTVIARLKARAACAESPVPVSEAVEKAAERFYTKLAEVADGASESRMAAAGSCSSSGDQGGNSACAVPVVVPSLPSEPEPYCGACGNASCDGRSCPDIG